MEKVTETIVDLDAYFSRIGYRGGRTPSQRETARTLD